jgi:hypothetical protein
MISLQAVGSIIDRKRTCRSCIIAVEKLDEIGAPDGHQCQQFGQIWKEIGGKIRAEGKQRAALYFVHHTKNY